MKKENKQYLKETLIIIILGILINAACFLIGSFHSKAATQSQLDTNEPPFVVMNNTDLSYLLNGQFDYETLVNNVKQKYNLSDSNFIIATNGASLRSYSSHWCVLLNIYDNVSYYGNVLQVNDVTEERLTFEFSGKAENVYYDLSTNSIVGKWDSTPDVSWSSSTGTISLLGPVSTSTYNDGVYYFTTFYPIYVNNTIYMYDGTTPIISQYSFIVPGDFIELPGLEQILNNISNSFTPHTNDTPPTYDSTISDGQNISNAINGHSQNMNNAINNLGNNIKSWFDNLLDKLTQGFNSVSQNIWNGFKTLMDNIKDFFGAKLDFIIDKFNYITEPLSLEELTTNLNNGSFSSDLLGVIVSVESFKSSFTSGTEPNSCSFTLDFSNAFYNFGVCTFSLDWLLPIRPIIRLFLGGLCVYSLIVSIFTSLNTYIGGTSSINDDI